MSEKVVLGIDGGGSKTRVVAIVADPDAPPDVIAAADSGPCNIANITVPEAIGNVGHAISRLGIDLATVIAVCAGVAGFSYDSRRRDFLAALAEMHPGALSTVIPDFVAAHMGANAGEPGVTAIAGTGSVAYGRNAQGRQHRAGGYGYLIDDAGSGYGIGRMAVAAALHAGDGSGPPTVLSEALADELGSVERTVIVPDVYGGRIDRVKMASLAPIVARVASDGDEVAREILTHAAGAQAASVIAVARVLFSPGDAFPVALFGGVWKAGTLMAQPLQVAVAAEYPASTIRNAIMSAELGAALHARWEASAVGRPEAGQV